MPPKTASRKVADLKPAPNNPRMISPEQLALLGETMRKFGDLSGIVLNLRTGHLVGGHQRVKNLDPTWKIVKHQTKDSTGTVALGRIMTPFGQWSYREVRWPKQKELAANLAANKISGEWDEEKLSSIFQELKINYGTVLTGFTDAEIGSIITNAETLDLKESTPRGATEGLTLIPYLGGKAAITPYLVNMLPEHSAYIEVFGGGASLLLNKPPSDLEVYNDLDGELVNLFETIRNNIDAFVKKAEFLLYSRELNERWKRDLMDGKVPEDPVERALRFWYLMRSSFAAQPYKGWAFAVASGAHSSPAMWNALEDAKRVHERIKKVEIDHLDFEHLIKNRDAPSTLFFLDPPYLGAEEYRLGVFPIAEHKRLADTLLEVQGKWLMTIGDAPEIRELYPGQIRGGLNTVGSVSKVFASNGDARTSLVRNLIVSNYPLPDSGQLEAAE